MKALSPMYFGCILSNALRVGITASRQYVAYKGDSLRLRRKISPSLLVSFCEIKFERHEKVSSYLDRSSLF